MIEIGDRVEVLFDGEWQIGEVKGGSGKNLFVRLRGHRDALAFEDPAQVPGACEKLRLAPALKGSALRAAQRLANCQAGKCELPELEEGSSVKLFFCPDCRKKWRIGATGNWELEESFQLTAEQEADVEQLGEVRITSSSGGQKGQKLARYDLIPGEALRKIAELYGRGAAKYEDRNWERGYDWSLSFAALQRHIWQFWGGEDMDEEMGMEHVACAIFHALALLEFMDTHPEFDDRPGSENEKGPSESGNTH